MRLLLLFPALILSLTLRVPAADAPVLHGQRVLVLGDSITQDGRYVSFLEYYLHRAGQRADLVSIGLSSETLSGLSEAGHPFPRPCVLERLDRALKAVQPAVVLACYGMNDGIYHPASPERLAAFDAGLRKLITAVRATGARLVIVTPPVFDPVPLAAKVVPATAETFGYGRPYAGYDDVLADFARLELAISEPDVTVIDLHAPMAQALAAARARDPGFSFAPDGVHPGDGGHLFIAGIIARGLGLTVRADDADTELARIQAEPVFALIHARRALRSETWLPFVGYSRGQTFKSDSVKAAEAVAVRLEREIAATAAAR